MGEKVIYVEGRTGARYPAEITGPVDKIHKPKLKRTGSGDHDITVEKPGETILKMGEQKIMGTTANENRTRPYVNLTVNFGDDAHPRYGDVSGVRLKDNLDKNFRKSYYEPIASEGSEEESAKAAKAAEDAAKKESAKAAGKGSEKK